MQLVTVNVLALHTSAVSIMLTSAVFDLFPTVY